MNNYTVTVLNDVLCIDSDSDTYTLARADVLGAELVRRDSVLGAELELRVWLREGVAREKRAISAFRCRLEDLDTVRQWMRAPAVGMSDLFKEWSKTKAETVRVRDEDDGALQEGETSSDKRALLELLAEERILGRKLDEASWGEVLKRPLPTDQDDGA